MGSSNHKDLTGARPSQYTAPANIRAVAKDTECKWTTMGWFNLCTQAAAEAQPVIFLTVHCRCAAEVPGSGPHIDGVKNEEGAAAPKPDIRSD